MVNALRKSANRLDADLGTAPVATLGVVPVTQGGERERERREGGRESREGNEGVIIVMHAS